MKRVLYSLGVLLLVLMGAALVVPSFVNWNTYKTQIAGEVSALTGRKLDISGNISFAVLPLPTLSAQNVRLANLDGATNKDMFSLDTLEVRIALLPLLTGTIQVQDVTLIRPVINLETISDGRNNWDFTKVTRTTDAPSNGGASGSLTRPLTQPAAPAGGAPPIRLDNLIIEDGKAEYRNAATGVTESIDDINLVIAAESLAGPFRADGGLTIRGLPLDINIRVAGIGKDKATPINAIISPRDSDATISLGGLLSGLSGGLGLRGKIMAEGPSLARLLKVVNGRRSSAPSLPFALEGSLLASAERIDINDVSLTLKDDRFTGAVSMVPGDIPQIDAAFTFTRFELEPWLRAAAINAAIPAPKSKPAATASSTQSPTPAPVPAPTTHSPFTLPRHMVVNLDLSGEAITYNDGMISQPTLNASLVAGTLTVNKADARLPGGGVILLQGGVSAYQGEPYIDATLQSKADDFRGLLSWLGVDVSDVPTGRLRLFSLAFGLRGSPSQLQLYNLDGVLDTTTLQGAATARLSGRPAIGLNVKIDSLNLDAYTTKPKSKAADGPAPSHAQAAPQPSLSGALSKTLGDAKKGPFASLGFLNTFDANVKARLGELVTNGMTIGNVEFDGSLLNGRLALTKARTSDLAGASMAISGGLSGFGGTPSFDNFAYHFLTKAPASWARTMGLQAPVDLTKFNSVALSGTLTGDLTALAVETRAEAGGLVTTAKGNIADPLGRPTFDLAIEASHASLIRMINLFADSYRPADPNLGSFALSTKVKGGQDQLEFTDLRTRLGPVNLAGNTKVKLDRERPKIEGALNGGDINISAFLPAKKVAWVPVELSIQPTDSNSPSASEADTVQLAAVTGSQRWSHAPLDLSVLQAVDANLTIKAVNLIYDRFVVSDPRAVVTVKNGLAEIINLKGKMFGGAFHGAGRLDSNDTPSFSAQLDAQQANIKRALLSSAGMDVADGTLDMSANLRSEGRSVFGLISALNGHAKLNVTDGVIQGIDLDRINAKLNNMNNIGGILGLVQAGMTGGATPFDSLKGSFQVDRGVVTTTDLTLLAPSGTGKSVAKVNLPDWSIDAKADFTLSGNSGAPPFSMTVTGPLDNPRKIMNINAFQKFLAAKGIGTLLKGKGGGKSILQQLIPGTPQPEQPPAAAAVAPATNGGWGAYNPNTQQQPQSQQQPEPQQPKKKLKAKDLLKGLLQGLGR